VARARSRPSAATRDDPAGDRRAGGGSV